jgi:hypothetical protein
MGAKVACALTGEFGVSWAAGALWRAAAGVVPEEREGDRSLFLLASWTEGVEDRSPLVLMTRGLDGRFVVRQAGLASDDELTLPAGDLTPVEFPPEFGTVAHEVWNAALMAKQVVVPRESQRIKRAFQLGCKSTMWGLLIVACGLLSHDTWGRKFAVSIVVGPRQQAFKAWGY